MLAFLVSKCMLVMQNSLRIENCKVEYDIAFMNPVF